MDGLRDGGGLVWGERRGSLGVGGAAVTRVPGLMALLGLGWGTCD